MNDTLEKSDTRPAAVQDALATILSDDKFVAAPQMTAFLRYVVQQTLDGQSSRIKAYTVAVDALGKPPTFDPQNDPSVRVLAKRLRSSLDQYYERNPDVTLKIEMKAGSYIPAFVDNNNDVSKKADLTDTMPVSTREIAAQTVSPQETTAAMPSPVNISTTIAQQSVELRQPTLAATDFSSPSAEKQADTGIRSDSSLTNTPEIKPTATPRLSNTVNKATAKNSTGPVSMLAGKFSHIPRLALALPVLVGVLWFAANRDSATDSHVLAAAMPEADAISTLDISRARPTVPTILITTESAKPYPCHLIANSLSTALLGSNAVDIYRETSMGNIELVWPEDYQLNLSSVKVGDQAHVTMQLLHAQSGQVIQADTIKLAASAESGFSIEDVDTIEAIANSFIDSNSTMMQSFNAIQDDKLQTEDSSHDI